MDIISVLILAFSIPSSSSLPLTTQLSVRDELRCVPTTGYDILVFFLSNYFAYAATSPSPPGSGITHIIRSQLRGLLFPFGALLQTIGLLFYHCVFGEDELGKALSVGALAVVVRTESWKPLMTCREKLHCANIPAELVQDLIASPEQDPLQEERLTAAIVVSQPQKSKREDFFGVDHLDRPLADYEIHGNHTPLPEGFRWAIPSPIICSALVNELKDRRMTHLARSRSFLKMATSIVQLVLSSITIYRTRGPQLDRYGYTAFGLSVFPYTFMSLVNFIYLGCVGEYSHLTMLHTSTLREAKGRSGGEVCGEVGILRPEEENDEEAETAEGEGQKLLEDGTQTAVWLWTEDESVLCAKIHNTIRRFTLVDSENSPSIIFGVHPVTTKLNIYSPGAEPTEAILPGDVSIYRSVADSFHKANGYLGQMYLGLKMATVFASPILATILPYLLLYSLSGFKKQQSTFFQRLVMISWLVQNQLALLYTPFEFFYRFSTPKVMYQSTGKEGNKEEGNPRQDLDRESTVQVLGRVILMTILFSALACFAFLMYSVPIAYFVVVGKMLKEFTTCTLVDT